MSVNINDRVQNEITLTEEIRENIVDSMEVMRTHHEDDMFEYQVDFSKQDDESLIYYRDEWIVDLDEVISDEEYADDMRDLYYGDGIDIYKYFGVENTDNKKRF